MSKRKPRAASAQPAVTRSASRTSVDNTIDFKSYAKYKKSVNLIPKSLSQEQYIELLEDDSKHIVFATGPAGTGKTMLAVLAGIKALKEGKVAKIIVTRPAVGTDDEKHGFLPGDLNAKMEPWTRPIFDVMEEYYSPNDIVRMLDEKIIEISPLAFMRGRTFKNSWIIFDEAQNSTINQTKMALTRIGEGSKMIVTGDLAQHDRKFTSENGFRDFIEKIKEHNSPMMGLSQFSQRDVQRHPVVAQVLKMYGEE